MEFIKCRDMIKNCVICNRNRKNIFRKPAVLQIIPKLPEDIYQIDLTVLPVKLQTDDNAKYFLCIIDIFSKYGYCYILNNKRADTILGYIKDFINKYGKPNGLQSDNGKEFRNSLLSDYCKENGIKFFQGRQYHPQSQGVIESFNKEIKRLLEVKYMENSKKFSIYSCLPDVIKINNENMHSTTNYKPNDLLDVSDKNIIKKVIDNIKNSQRKFKKNIDGFKINTKCLLCENFEKY